MGKRSNFERRERDFYETPEKAVLPLLPHLKQGSFFIEPCAGAGKLIKHLEKYGHICYFKSDIEPMADDILRADIFSIIEPFNICGLTITNPPWDRKLLHPMVEHFIRYGNQTWLLFDSDWMHTKQATPYLPYCHKIVSIGRVSWLDDGKCGKDNACWYLFKNTKCDATQFIGRNQY